MGFPAVRPIRKPDKPDRSDQPDNTEHSVSSSGLEAALTTFERETGAAVKALTAAYERPRSFKPQLRAASCATSGPASTVPGAVRPGGRGRSGPARRLDLRRGRLLRDGGSPQVLALGAARNLHAFESDDRILSYPVIVRRLTATRRC